MIKSPFKYLSFLAIAINIGCASLPKESLKMPKQLLKEDNLSLLHGTYQIDLSSGHGPLNSVLDILYRPPAEQPKINPSSAYTLWINSIGQDSLSLALYSNFSQVVERKVRIKKIDNDYVYLKNSNVKIHNIPFIMGGYNYQATRFAVDTTGRLIIDSVHYAIGCGLIIFCAGGPTFRTNYLYAKAKPN